MVRIKFIRREIGSPRVPLSCSDGSRTAERPTFPRSRAFPSSGDNFIQTWSSKVNREFENRKKKELFRFHFRVCLMLFCTIFLVSFLNTEICSLHSFFFFSSPFRETNLKFKMALEATHQYLQNENSLATFDGLCKHVLFSFQLWLLDSDPISSNQNTFHMWVLTQIISFFKRFYRMWRTK